MCETINMTATDQPEPAVSDFMGNVMAVAALAYYAPMFIAFGDAGYTLFHQLRDWLRTGVWVPHELWQACALVVGIDPDCLKHQPQGWMAGPGSGPIFLKNSFQGETRRFRRCARGINAVFPDHAVEHPVVHGGVRGRRHALHE